MGGAVGAGGLGQIALQYGYQTYNPVVMNTVIVLLVILVNLIQFGGEYLMKSFISIVSKIAALRCL